MFKNRRGELLFEISTIHVYSLRYCTIYKRLDEGQRLQL